MAASKQSYAGTSWDAVLNPGGATDYFAGGIPGPMDAGAHGFSPVNAWWLSELSRLVYRRSGDEGGSTAPGRQRRDFLSDVGLVEHAFFDSGSAQAAFITRPHAKAVPALGILVFRGTRGTWRNWRTNADFRPVPWPSGGRVHSGFRKQFMALWPSIEDLLENWRAPLFYTGHSLGAALATLAAAMYRPDALYTFGSPRVGDADFVRSLADIPIYRMYNPRDIVTTLPPARSPFGFRHAGVPIDNKLTAAASMPETPADRQRVRRFGMGFSRPPRFLADHAPITYLGTPPPSTSP